MIDTIVRVVEGLVAVASLPVAVITLLDMLRRRRTRMRYRAGVKRLNIHTDIPETRNYFGKQ